MKKVESEVFTIWGRCLAKGKNSYQNLDNPIGRGLLNDYVYDKEKLEANKENIKRILGYLDLGEDEIRYFDLAYSKNHEKWTLLNQKIEMLSSLLEASGLLEFEVDSASWDKREAENPRIKIKKEIETPKVKIRK